MRQSPDKAAPRKPPCSGPSRRRAGVGCARDSSSRSPAHDRVPGGVAEAVVKSVDEVRGAIVAREQPRSEPVQPGTAPHGRAQNTLASWSEEREPYGGQARSSGGPGFASRLNDALVERRSWRGLLVVCGKGRLGEDIQPSKEAEGLIEIEIADMAAALLVQQL